MAYKRTLHGCVLEGVREGPPGILHANRAFRELDPHGNLVFGCVDDRAGQLRGLERRRAGAR